MTRTLRSSFNLILALSLAASLHAAAKGPDEGTPRGQELFRTKVRKLLTDRCLKCHGGRKTEGQWNITTREKMLKGGKHHKTGVIVPYEPQKSKVLLMVQKLAKPYMPPKHEWITEQNIRDLYVWIANGAPFDGTLEMPHK